MTDDVRPCATCGRRLMALMRGLTYIPGCRFDAGRCDPDRDRRDPRPVPEAKPRTGRPA